MSDSSPDFSPQTIQELQAARDAAIARAERWQQDAARAFRQAEINNGHAVERLEQRDAALASNAALRSALKVMRGYELNAHSGHVAPYPHHWRPDCPQCNPVDLVIDVALRDTSGAENPLVAERDRLKAALRALLDMVRNMAAISGGGFVSEIVDEAHAALGDFANAPSL